MKIIISGSSAVGAVMLKHLGINLVKQKFCVFHLEEKKTATEQADRWTDDENDGLVAGL